MTEIVQTYKYIKEFSCIGDKCENSCCQGNWLIKVDDKTFEKYEKEKPELLDYVKIDEKGKSYAKKPDSNECVAFDGGLCNIHKNHGASYLSNVCYFYPKILVKFDDSTRIMSYNSCPEIVRNILYNSNEPFELVDTEFESADENFIKIKKSEIGELENNKLNTFQNFFNYCKNAQKTTEAILLDVVNTCISLNNIGFSDWSDASKFLFETIEMRKTNVFEEKKDDIFRLLALLNVETRAKDNKLKGILDKISNALSVRFYDKDFSFSYKNHSFELFQKRKEMWDDLHEENFSLIMRKFLLSQLIYSTFPFKGGDNNLITKSVFLVIRYLLVKLSLICYMKEDGTPPTEAEVVHVIHVLERALEHITEFTSFHMNVNEIGWIRESGLASLINLFIKEEVSDVISY